LEQGCFPGIVRACKHNIVTQLEARCLKFLKALHFNFCNHFGKGSRPIEVKYPHRRAIAIAAERRHPLLAAVSG